MGIKNLKIILEKKCNLAINTRKLDNYRGMVFGIDISIFLYKYLYNNGDHLEGLTRLCLRLLKNQITPVFVFDGKPPKEKDEIIKNRKERRDFISIKKDLYNFSTTIEKNDFNEFKNNILIFIENTDSSFVINDNEIENLFKISDEDLKKDVEKLNKKIVYVTQYHIESSKKLFNLFGIKYIHAPSEAEALIAVLCKNNIFDGCISEDTDILANGGHLFLKNFNADKNFVDEYCLEGILDQLELTYYQFIDLCILCGCDYTAKILGLGPINAHKIMQKYGNIELFIENNVKFKIPNNFNYIKARELFKNPVDDNILSKLDKDTKMSEPKLNELIEFLKNTKLKEKYLNEIKCNVMNYYFDIEGTKSINQSNNKRCKMTDFYNKI